MYCIKITADIPGIRNSEYSDYYNGMKINKAYPDKMELKTNKSGCVRKHFKTWKKRESVEKEIEKIKNSIRYVDDYKFEIVEIEEDKDYSLYNWIKKQMDMNI